MYARAQSFTEQCRQAGQRDHAQAGTEPIGPGKDAHHGGICLRSACVTGQRDRHPDTTLLSAQQRMGQAPVAKIIGNLIDAAVGGDRIDVRLEDIAQVARRLIRAAEMRFEGEVLRSHCGHQRSI